MRGAPGIDRAQRGRSRSQAVGESVPREGDQLELELNDVRLRIPWGGRSPRSLTECGKLFIHWELPAGGPNADANQFTLFLKGNQHGS